MTHFIKATYHSTLGTLAYDVLCTDCRYHPDTAPVYSGDLMQHLTPGDLDPRDGEPWACCICGTVDESGMESSDYNAEPWAEYL